MQSLPSSPQPIAVLRDRVATAVALVVGLLLFLFFLPALGWTAVATLVLAVAAWEWGGFIQGNGAARIAYAAVTTVMSVTAAYAVGLTNGGPGALALAPVYTLALVFWVAVVPLWLGRRPAGRSRMLILLFGWAVLIPAFLGLVQLRNMHPAVLLLFMTAVWIADIAAYFVGSRFGRRKLAPRISPGKTWEGVVGALIATAVYALLWIFLLRRYAPAVIRDLPGTVLWMVLLIEALVALSVLGDLFESAMKRQAGLKDSGKVLPGHGGLLDRIDALTPVLPAAALVSMI